MFAHQRKARMNFKLLFKAILILAVLAVLVIMGMHNPQPASLKLPPMINELTQPSAYMYYLFFGVGFVVGAILMTGGKKGSSKPAKEK